MKKRIYLPVLLVLLAALPVSALAAGPSTEVTAVCDAQSHNIAYPTAAVNAGSANCLAEYTIPYPAADFEGDGISSFVRSAAISSSADTDAYSDSSFAGYAIPYPAVSGVGSSVGYVIPYPSAADLAETASAP